MAIVVWGPIGRGEAGPTWVSGGTIALAHGGVDRPTPAQASSKMPLGSPAGVSGNLGGHEFLMTQPGSTAPVTHDPCRPITYVVNDRTAPSGADTVLTAAVAEVATASGMQFIHEGPSSEIPSSARRAFQPERYGDRWAPVLIAWSNPQETADLAGEVAGIGGSTAFQQPDGTSTYVSGTVILDGPQLAALMSGDGGPAQARAIVIHELGHLLGLDHVEDESQLMNPRGVPDVTSLQGGDRAGLALLGLGPCRTSL